MKGTDSQNRCLTMEEQIQAAVAAAPEPSDAQVARLAQLLFPRGGSK